MTKRLMFRSSIAFAPSSIGVSLPPDRSLAPGENKQTVVVAAEKPSVTVCALVNLSFSDCHAGPVLVDMEAGNGGNVCPIVNGTPKMLS